MAKGSRLFKQLFWSLMSATFVVLVIIAAMMLYIEKQLPNVEKLKDAHLQVPLRIYTQDKKLIAQFGVKRRIPIKLEQVPKLLVDAVLATEDARFYQHPGVDLKGVARAGLAVLTSGKKVQGASTITMQVARNFYLSREKTYVRKIREILLALKIDGELSKNKILELYLNKIYFGNRAYGVAASAQVYYGKSLDQLSLAQMAMIAGLPQAPSRNNPLENPTAALKRRNHVLARMLELGLIKKDQYAIAVAAPITAEYHRRKIEAPAPYLAEMVRESMVEEYGSGAYERGLSVYTTLQSRLQVAASHALTRGLSDYDRRHGFRHSGINFGEFDQKKWQAALAKSDSSSEYTPAAVLEVLPQSIGALLQNGEVITIPWSGLSYARPELENGHVGSLPQDAASIAAVGDLIYVTHAKGGSWRLTQIPAVQGAIIALDPQDGAITALCGGLDYNFSNFNRVIQAERQPGSNFKPFVYSAALNKGYTLATIINDAPIVQQDTGENQLWRPTNDTLKFYGPTPLRVGLIKSRNLVSVRLLRGVGVPYTLDYVKRFGFDPNVLPHSLSLALGSGAVTPLQIAVGYAVFANGGYRVTPYFIGRIVDQHGRLLYEADPADACRACLLTEAPDEKDLPSRQAPRVISPQNAYLMTQAMRDVIQYGTGRGAKVLRRTDLAGKTGTTNNQVDAWFSGFNSNMVATVWVGFDNMKSLREYGAKAALPVWVNFMRYALQGSPMATMPEPPNMITVRVDPATGLLAPPSLATAKFEIFRQQFAPRQYGNDVVAGGASENNDQPSNASDQLF